MSLCLRAQFFRGLWLRKTDLAIDGKGAKKDKNLGSGYGIDRNKVEDIDRRKEGSNNRRHNKWEI